MSNEAPDWTHTGKRLDAVNGAFHDAYAGVRSEAQSSHPILILRGDILVLRRGDARTERSVTPPGFYAVRSAAHAPLALYALVRGEQSVAALHERLTRALAGLENEELDADAAEAVRTVLEATLRESGSIQERGADALRMKTFAREAGPPLLALTGHATRLQLASLHAGVEDLVRLLTSAERGSFEVVVAGAHQARDRSLAMQYFRKRLEEPEGRDERVVYAENTADEEAALQLIGTRRVDRDIALAFFGDSKRLQRDVLGDAAAQQLVTMVF